MAETTGGGASPAGGAGESTPAGQEHSRLFTGRSGQLAVMAEFLHRGINVATPEVDVGDDVFVVRGNDETVTRVQVKSANGTAQRGGSYYTQFNVPWLQLASMDAPPLVYVFAARYENRWSDFVVIRRRTLKRLQTHQGAGSIIYNDAGEEKGLNLRLVFTAGDVRNKHVSFQPYRGAFMPWPPRE